jgi:hypothetical protein
LEKAGEFILLDMLKAIPNLKKTTIEADIELQLHIALVSTIAAIDLSLNTAIDNTAVQVDYIALQADFVPLIGLDSKDIIDYNYLNAEDDADTRLF